MVQFEDYYSILGVSRQATADEIKKAYRSLARKHHPDSNPNDKVEAENRFKKINEAHEVLANPEKKARYDSLGRIPHGAEFRPPGGGGSANSPFGQGTAAGAGSFRDIFDLLFQSGNVGGADPFGAGTPRSIDGEEARFKLTLTLEEALKGASKKLNLRNLPSLEVKIPAGVREGSKIRLSGQGYPSAYGGKRGDLILEILLAPHPDFKLEGNDLESGLIVTVSEAVLGTTKEVKTVHGSFSLNIPAGVQPNQRLRLSAQGWPKKEGGLGDHFVRVSVKIPLNPDPKMRQLFEDLAQLET